MDKETLEVILTQLHTKTNIRYNLQISTIPSHAIDDTESPTTKVEWWKCFIHPSYYEYGPPDFSFKVSTKTKT
jgi:hypothetical protein